MRNWLISTPRLEDVERLLLISSDLNATRKNILSKSTVVNKLSGWRQMNAFQAISDNTSFIESWLSNKELQLYHDYGTEDRQHYYAKLPISDVIEFLSKFKFQNVPDSARKQATLRYLKDRKSVV